jgi:uncharacterized protein YjbJ (UPF0337 family)
MNKDQFQGAWKQLAGKVKEKWGKLTDDDIARINGKREALIGLIQQKYGIAKERAEEELTRFEETVGSGASRSSSSMGSNPSNAGPSSNQGNFRSNNPNQQNPNRRNER